MIYKLLTFLVVAMTHKLLTFLFFAMIHKLLTFLAFAMTHFDIFIHCILRNVSGIKNNLIKGTLSLHREWLLLLSDRFADQHKKYLNLITVEYQKK